MQTGDNKESLNNPVKIVLFRWAGTWGPFSIKIPCGECSLTKDVIIDTLKTELKGLPLELDIREWLSEWWRPLLRGGWHAPIVMVEDKVISQGRALNRGLLAEAVIGAYARSTRIEGSHLFGKEGCPHCNRAKELLEKSEIEYTYHDVVKSPAALYEMLARVKPLIGPKTPVTVPQIWLDGTYIGGADQLVGHMQGRKNSVA
ncbi:MAG: glutaredoxin [Proteobacteria bacterium]|nr:glutaredoxin [Pseudomonadota bacterium]